MAANESTKGDYTALPAVSLPRALWVEVCGTFFLVLAGTAVVVSAALARPIAGAPNNSLAVGLTFGFTLVALVAAFGCLSGAHFNPAVTLGLASARKFPWKDTIQYIIAQLVGAILAALAVWITFGNAARNIAFLGATYPAPTASNWQAFLIEAIVTFFLVLVVVAVTTDRRVPAPIAAPAIGFALGDGRADRRPDLRRRRESGTCPRPNDCRLEIRQLLGLYPRPDHRRHLRRGTLPIHGAHLRPHRLGQRRKHRADAEESGVSRS